jgi:alpha-L-fucosidase
MNKIGKMALAACTILLQIQTGNSQQYQPNWESLDSRPVPQWFKDSKFGIFIHWGMYAVPGWSSKGSYSEWYQYGLNTGDSARIKFHKDKFGDRSYYDLAKDFKAELFKPDEWAKLFEKSGAKYIVLTSKHHDGYTLWPSKEASKSWGFPWTAAEVGPKRDLLGDLFDAVRKTSVRPGMYYSLYEWFNPIWKTDRKKYVDTHMWPQMKELLTKYQPEVLFTDGEWDASAETWKSQEFLAWAYNESPVKDKIVTYDRWGSGIRFNHGGVFTPEYQPELDFENHAWEESRGMGFSYGYNREEDAWDYNSTQSLVIALIDKVSRGGNFLLDIGPDEHGKIPPIMQQRLLEMGDWLNINGEAIYNTSRWIRPSQWSEGKTDFKYKNEHDTEDWKTGGDLMLKLTVDPDPGYAVKEAFFTYNTTSNSLYAIFPKYPDNNQLVLQNITLPAGTKLSFLSTKENLLWKQEGQNLVVTLPTYNPNKIKAPYAYALKIENYGAFVSKPSVNISYPSGAFKPTITLKSTPGATIYYTLDGSEPTASSSVYTKPFVLDKTATLKTNALAASLLPSSTNTQEAIAYEWIGASKVSKASPGIAYTYYEPSENINIVDAFKSPVVNSGVASKFSVEKKQRKEKFALEFKGFIKIDKNALYTFLVDADDGSQLIIDGKEIPNNGKIALKIGLHRITLRYFDSGGNNSLKVEIQPDGRNKKEITADMLMY